MAVTTALDVLRHSNTVEGNTLNLMEQMRQELIAKLAGGDLTTWNKDRLRQLLKDTEVIITSYYTKAQTALVPTYSAVTNATASQTAAGLGVTVPSKAVLNAVVTDFLITGSPARAWWEKQAADTAFRFSAAIRQGIVQSETMPQIFKRVNEAIGIAGRNAKTLTHTSVMAVMNAANLATLEDNSDVAPAVRWMATLDSSTCPSCGERDGLEWDTETYEPIDHDIPFESPPLHWGCRCKLVAVTDLSRNMAGQRASMFGPVDRKMTFSDFLKRQSLDFQTEVLGKGRAELYRAGKITLSDLVSGSGAPLSLAKLNSKYSV